MNNLNSVANIVLIIDFGSQYTQLIARRIRNLNFYCEIIACYKFDLNNLDIDKIGVIILSGGPNSIHEESSPNIDQRIFEINKPILGICYGMQLISQNLGGVVGAGDIREFGSAYVHTLKKSLLTDEWCNEGCKVHTWMSHGDCVKTLPSNFNVIACSENNNLAIIGNEERRIYGIQFHPEVTNTDNGDQLLLNFITKVGGIKENWTMGNLVEMKLNAIKEIVDEDSIVIAAVSGGVDSTVASVLTSKIIGKRLKCIFIDTGLLRKNEGQQVQEMFKKHNVEIECIDAKEIFLTELKGVSDPEQKRKIIGRLFIECFEKEAKKYDNAKFLMQGTLYTDIIESVSPNGSPSVTIKSHHNVGGLPERMNFKLLEPLKDLFKDEVRKLGLELGISNDFLKRHPFPGPGLAIRIDGEVTEEKVALAQEIDAIFMDSIKEFGIYDDIWQAFAFLSDMRSVGVMGDGRTYERACVLRAITSIDGMTAKVYPMAFDYLEKIASRIVNNVRGVNRVFYDYTSKPPATIEFQ
jgi:GMP synthase (glutamine-hydrolysing)